MVRASSVATAETMSSSKAAQFLKRVGTAIPISVAMIYLVSPAINMWTMPGGRRRPGRRPAVGCPLPHDLFRPESAKASLLSDIGVARVISVNGIAY